MNPTSHYYPFFPVLAGITSEAGGRALIVGLPRLRENAIKALILNHLSDCRTPTFSASGTTVNGGVLADAGAALSIEGGLLKIVLTNNLNVADFSPYSVGSNLSVVQVTINGSYNLSNCIFKPEDQVKTWMKYFRTSDPAYLGKLDGWGIGSNGLTALGFGPSSPDQTIIGSGAIANVSKLNSSITNEPHQPIILQTATFYLELPDALEEAEHLEFSDAQFFFGTTGDTIVQTPEPTVLFSLGIGLLCLGVLRRF